MKKFLAFAFFGVFLPASAQATQWVCVIKLTSGQVVSAGVEVAASAEAAKSTVLQSPQLKGLIKNEPDAVNCMSYAAYAAKSAPPAPAAAAQSAGGARRTYRCSVLTTRGEQVNPIVAGSLAEAYANAKFMEQEMLPGESVRCEEPRMREFAIAGPPWSAARSAGAGSPGVHCCQAQVIRANGVANPAGSCFGGLPSVELAEEAMAAHVRFAERKKADHNRAQRMVVINCRLDRKIDPTQWRLPGESQAGCFARRKAAGLQDRFIPSGCYPPDG